MNGLQGGGLNISVINHWIKLICT